MAACEAGVDFGEFRVGQEAGGDPPAGPPPTQAPLPPFPSVQGQAENCGDLCVQPLRLLQHAAPSHHQEWYVPGGVGPYSGGSHCGGGPDLHTLPHWVSSPPGSDAVMPNAMKKFVIHATCLDSLDLQEQESYLIMGQTSDLWRVKSECVVPPAALGTQAWVPLLPQPRPWCQDGYHTWQQETWVSEQH